MSEEAKHTPNNSGNYAKNKEAKAKGEKPATGKTDTMASPIEKTTMKRPARQMTQAENLINQAVEAGIDSAKNNPTSKKG